MVRLPIALAALVAGCGSPEHGLVLEARSDLLAGVEAFAAHARIDGPDGAVADERVALGAVDLAEGARLVERGRLPEGTYDLTVTLLDGAGDPIVERSARARLSGDLVVTLVLTASCRGVACGVEQTCVAGRCESATCTDDEGAPCAPDECAAAADCPAPPDACVTASCAEGTCLAVPDDGACGAFATCERERGCQPTVPTEPWSTPIPLDALNTAANQEDDPTLTQDLLEMIFRSDRNGPDELFTSTRDSVDDPWRPPTPIAELNETVDTNPMLSRDGLTLFWRRDADIRVATRTARGAPWVVGRTLDELDVWPGTACPAPSPDLTTIYFCAQHPDGMGALDVIRATRATPDALFGPPERVVELSTLAQEANGYFGIPGGRVFYFTSDRVAADDRDLFVARRATADGPFDPPTRIDELASPADDENPWVSDDERTMFFASGRDGALGLYMTTR